MTPRKDTIALVTLFLLGCAYSDGMIHIYDDDAYSWRALDEDSQVAFIDYRDGIESMTLAVDVSDFEDVREGKLVWIFPVPAGPEETTIDITQEFPRLDGIPLDEINNGKIHNVFGVARLTQVYTLFLCGCLYFGIFNAERGGDGVTVHSHIEEAGLTAELITAEDGKAFQNYVEGKNLRLPAGSMLVLEDYIGEDYSFVVMWVLDISRLKPEEVVVRGYYPDEGGWKNKTFLREKGPLGISVMFPTEDIYFPMKPTSIYGEKRVPILIYVMGAVDPSLPPQVKDDSETTYFSGGPDYYYFDNYYRNYYFNKLHMFYNTTGHEGHYTKIKMNVTSKYLTEDLWMDDSPSGEFLALKKRGEFLDRNFLVILLVVVILSSCLASVMAGIFVYRGAVPITKLALLGLSNVLTLVAFISAVRIVLPQYNGKEVETETSGTRMRMGRQLKLGVSVVCIVLLVLFLFLTAMQGQLLGMFVALCMIAFFLWQVKREMPKLRETEPVKHVKRMGDTNSKFIILFSLLFIMITFVLELIFQQMM